MSEEKMISVKLASPAKVGGKFCRAGDIVTVSEAVAAHLEGERTSARTMLAEMTTAVGNDLLQSLDVANGKLAEYEKAFDAFGVEIAELHGLVTDKSETIELGLRRIKELEDQLGVANKTMQDLKDKLTESEAAREKAEAELAKVTKPAKAKKDTETS